MRQNIGTSPAPSSKSCYLGCPGGDAELSRPRHEGQEHREQAGGEPEAQQDAPAQGVRRRGTFFFFFQVFGFTFNFEAQHPHRTIYQVMCSFVYTTRLASRTRFYPSHPELLYRYTVQDHAPEYRNVPRTLVQIVLSRMPWRRR